MTNEMSIKDEKEVFHPFQVAFGHSTFPYHFFVGEDFAGSFKAYKSALHYTTSCITIITDRVFYINIIKLSITEIENRCIGGVYLQQVVNDPNDPM